MPGLCNINTAAIAWSPTCQGVFERMPCEACNVGRPLWTSIGTVGHPTVRSSDSLRHLTLTCTLKSKRSWTYNYLVLYAGLVLLEEITLWRACALILFYPRSCVCVSVSMYAVKLWAVWLILYNSPETVKIVTGGSGG
jgi:hypothetical protein